MMSLSFPGDLLDPVAGVHIHPRGIRALAAATATLAPAAAPLASRRARSPSKPVLPLSSASRKRLKPLKQPPRPRTPATRLLRPRVRRPLPSRAPSPITQPGRAALLLHLRRRKVPELPQQASPSLHLTGHPSGPPSTRPAGTKMERGRTTLSIGTRGKHQHHRAKTRSEQLVLSCLLSHLSHCPKQFLST